MRLRPVALVALSALLLLAACDDDDRESRTTMFSGQLVFVEDESPLPDLTVTLFEPGSQTAVARTVSDAGGYFGFEGFPPGSYIPVVHADGYRPLFLHQARWAFEEGDQAHITLRLRRTLPMPGSENFVLTCRVIEQASDPAKPIANARAEMNFAAPGELAEVNWSEYTGWSNTLEATSDEDGMLELRPVQLVYIPPGDESFVPEFRVSAPGYRSRVVPRNDDPATAAVSVIPVRLVPGEDLGRITGVVRDARGEPVVDVPVSAEWRRVSEGLLRGGIEPVEDPSGPKTLLIPDGVARTDADGRFEIRGLPEGFYNVLAGPYPDDGWVGFIVQGVEIQGFNGVGEVELHAFRAVEPVAPHDGEILPDLPARIEWEPVPGATAYSLQLVRGQDGATSRQTLETSYFEINPGANFFKVGETFAWVVTAVGPAGDLSQTDRPLVFHIVRPFE